MRSMRNHIKLTHKSLEVSGPGAVRVAMAWFGVRVLSILAALAAAAFLGVANGTQGLAALSWLIN